MRRRLVTILLAAIVVMLAVPFGMAFTFDRAMPLRTHVVVARPVLPVTRTPTASILPEAGSLLLTGGVLIALAGVVRRAG